MATAEQTRIYRASHRQSVSIWAHNYYLQNRDRLLAANRAVAWKYRAKKRDHETKVRSALKLETLRIYSGMDVPHCACGEDRIVALTLSHLTPNRKRGIYGHGGIGAYRRLRKAGYPDIGVIVECLNCNVARDNWGRPPTEGKSQ